MYKSFVISILMSFAITAMAQGDSTKTTSTKKDTTKYVYIEINDENKDSILIYEFEEYKLKDFQTDEQRNEYKKLVRNVRFALPYAKLAAFRLQMMEDNLAMIETKKARHKYIKETEKAIKVEFMASLKKMSRSQGMLLLKLIHRETGKTSYEILKGYRGSAEAFYWSAFAKFYNAKLTVEYDTILDYQIEYIIKSYNLE
jgi:hypothetical protein